MGPRFRCLAVDCSMARSLFCLIMQYYNMIRDNGDIAAAWSRDVPKVAIIGCPTKDVKYTFDLKGVPSRALP